jgi:parallel beta-helix repeat protein
MQSHEAINFFCPGELLVYFAEADKISAFSPEIIFILKGAANSSKYALAPLERTMPKDKKSVILGAILFIVASVAPNTALGAPSPIVGPGRPGPRPVGTAESSGANKVRVSPGKPLFLGDPGVGSTLPAALAAIGSNQATLHLLPGSYVITGNLILPVNVGLAMEQGAVLALAPGAIFTIHGPLQAPLAQIFSGTGKVADGCLPVGYPEWWGARGDGASDDTAALQTCLLASRKTRLAAKTYKITAGVILPAGAELAGAGNNSIIYQAANTAEGIIIKDNVKIRHLCLRGSLKGGWVGNYYHDGIISYVFRKGGLDPASAPVISYVGRRAVIESLVLENWFDGVVLASDNKITDCVFRSCVSEGIYLAGHNNRVDKNQVYDVYSWGIDLNGGNNIVSNNRLSQVGKPSLPAPHRYDGGGICASAIDSQRPIANIRITGNVITDTGECPAIIVNDSGAPNQTIRDILVADNICYGGDAGTAMAGIRIIGGKAPGSSARRISVSGNKINRFTDDGIWLENLSDVTVNNNTVETIGPTKNCGLLLADLTNFVCQGNLIKDISGPHAVGLRLYGNCDRGKVADNLIKGGSIGFQWESAQAANITVSNNDFQDNVIAFKPLVPFSGSNIVRDNKGYNH